MTGAAGRDHGGGRPEAHDGTGGGPAVSVVMPVFNGAAHLADTLAGIDRQTFRDFEVVVVDDGSSDGTADMLRRYAHDRPEMRVHVLPQNRGVAVARNTALALARGRFLWFVDHDDHWSDEFLEVMVAAAVETGADVVVCAASKVARPGAPGRTLEGGPRWSSSEPGAYLRAMLTGQVKGYLWNKLFRRELFGPNPFPPLSSQEDFAGHVLIADRVASVVRIEPTLYQHVVRPGSITNSTPKMHNLNTCVQIVEHLTRSSPAVTEPALLRYFTLWFGNLAIIRTALRLQATDPASAAMAAQARRDIRWTDVVAAARYSPRVALRAVLVRAALPLYGPVYGRVQRLKWGGR